MDDGARCSRLVLLNIKVAVAPLADLMHEKTYYLPLVLFVKAWKTPALEIFWSCGALPGYDQARQDLL